MTAKHTVADLLALKGKRQLTELFVATAEEAAAADAAGIDMICVRADLWGEEMRRAAPRTFAIAGLRYGVHITADDNLRAAFALLNAGADACYCAASEAIVAELSREGVPVVGHVGLIPAKRTWTGGFKAVGKTASQALDVFRATKRLESAGAFAVEMEVVPARVCAEISSRTKMLVFSMGSGVGGDSQYLFARDVLGSHTDHYPRHAKRYRDFAAEHDRLQLERIAAFSEFAHDVSNGAFPRPEHLVAIKNDELAQFLTALGPVAELG